jgi:hypothetical protein
LSGIVTRRQPADGSGTAPQRGGGNVELVVLLVGSAVELVVELVVLLVGSAVELEVELVVLLVGSAVELVVDVVVSVLEVVVVLGAVVVGGVGVWQLTPVQPDGQVHV